jgi:hypothetical protein
MVRQVELVRLVLALLRLVLRRLVLALLRLVLRRLVRRRRIPPSQRHQAWPVPTGGCRPGLRMLPAVAWAYLPQREPVGVWELR